MPYIRLLSAKYPNYSQLQNEVKDNRIGKIEKPFWLKPTTSFRRANTKTYDIKSHLKYLQNEKYLSTLS